MMLNIFQHFKHGNAIIAAIVQHGTIVANTG